MVQIEEVIKNSPIKLPEGPLNLAREFAGLRAFLDWCNEQEEFTRGIRVTGTAQVKVMPTFLRMYETIGELTERAREPFEELNNCLQEMASFGLLTKDSEVGRFIQEWAGNTYFLSGFMARIARVPISEVAKLEPSSRDSIMPGYCAAAAHFSVDQLYGNSQLKELEQELAEASLALSDAQEKIGRQSESFVTKIEAFEAEQERVLAAYEEAMSLDVGKKYWERKFRRHNIAANAGLKSFRCWVGFGSAAIVILIIVAISAFACFPAFFLQSFFRYRSAPSRLVGRNCLFCVFACIFVRLAPTYNKQQCKVTSRIR